MLDHLAHAGAFLGKGQSSPGARSGFLAWILDEASEQDAPAVLAETSPPTLNGLRVLPGH